MERNREPRNKSPYHGQLTFSKGANNTQWGKRQSLQQIVLGKLDINSRRMQLDPCLPPYTTINSKWITDVNVRPETIKLLEEKIEKKLIDIGVDNGILNMKTEHRQQKQK